jgi:hypothetical protein
LTLLKKIANAHGEKQATRIVRAFEKFAETGRGDVSLYRRLEKGLELRVGRFRAVLQILDGTVKMVAVGMKKTRKI